MGQQNIIEMNGKQYDALTGALLGESKIKATPANRAKTAHHGRNIDGFVRQKSHQQPTIVKPQTIVAAKPLGVQPKPQAVKKQMDVRRVSPKAAIKPHQPERPKTLMRHVVKKPDVTMKPAIKPTAPSEVMAAPKGTIAKPLEKKLSVSSVNPVRLARSRHVSKSQHIRRFEQPRAQHVRPAQYATRPARPDLQAAPIAPQVIVTKAERPAVAEKPVDVFEAALAHANSHEQQTPAHVRRRSSRRHRLVNVMAGVGAFLLIGGFVTYMNMTNIELRVASMRAGFHAEMPHYNPTGYALDGGIESSEGRIAMNFRSGSSIYTVTQEASDWNSQTLLDQTSAQRGQPSQTIQSKGRTIYIYDQSNATWVNGGVRYQVSGNASLNADDLVALATSM